MLRGSEDVAAESRALVRAPEMDTTRAHAARLPCVAKATSRPIRRITRKVRILRASDGDRTPSTASEGMRKTMADLSAILGEEDEQDAIVEAIGSKEEKVRYFRTKRRVRENSSGK